VAYVDLRERRGEERRRGARGHRGERPGSPYLLLFAGFILAVPALSASYTALVQAPPGSLTLLYWIPPVALLSWAWWRLRRPRRRREAAGFGAEKLLLLPTRDAGGAITAVGAALETPLTVDEAEGILVRLANDGHLRVESHDGALYCVLPADLPPSGPLGRQ
jgi:hypothetical protein